MNFNDLILAKRLQKEINDEDRKKKFESNSKRRNEVALKTSQDDKLDLINPKLEYIDPNPDIHALFLHFDNIFFWKKLMAVEVKWSPRMTSCAGICCYQGRGGLCSIRLSLPLLKLRPRKDLVETLLHEMIHAYLFVTHNNRDRDGHGPEFHKHMHRINKSAGTKITVYHTFHDEVRSYQQHWWKCQGPCRNRPPYFGMVRRAMNRAPGPSDFWWADHKASCGGAYVKIREPEGYSASKKGGGKGAGGKGGTASSKKQIQSVTSPKGIEKPKMGIYGYFSPSNPSGDKKPPSMAGGALRGKTSQVSTLVVSQGSKATDANRTGTIKPFVPFSGKGQILGGGTSTQRPTPSSLGGTSTQRPTPSSLGGTSIQRPTPSSLGGKKGIPNVKKDSGKRNNGTSNNESPIKRPRKTHKQLPIDNISASSSSSSFKSPTTSGGQLVKCPVCFSLQNEATINEHLDKCIGIEDSADDDVVILDPPFPVKESEESWYLECPGCLDKVRESEFDQHLNGCKFINGGESPSTSLDEDNGPPTSDGDVESSSCPVCGQSLSSKSLGSHLETCLSSMAFDDDGEWN